MVAFAEAEPADLAAVGPGAEDVAQAGERGGVLDDEHPGRRPEFIHRQGGGRGPGSEVHGEVQQSLGDEVVAFDVLKALFVAVQLVGAVGQRDDLGVRLLAQQRVDRAEQGVVARGQAQGGT
ncbi:MULTISPECIES: hypothetical protein [Streptomyces]|uniref:Uncharacterized protein n=1 Tax=Streptomyces mordarskii TaxID=1226758 RepID=A0ABN1D5A8_9ACTN|nr:hypothetical protein OG751_47020 [Streptomyces antimycoticus]